MTSPHQAPAPAPVDHARLSQWIDTIDSVIDELHDDLVRRSIVHLTTLRQDLQQAADDTA